ncbi:MAG: cysteine peptidase family C39 domain-containing protein [Actinomycetota bacterium]
MVLLLLSITVHLAFLFSLASGTLNGLFNDATHRFGPGCDYFSIYAAGMKARLGEPVYPIGGHVEQVPYAYAFRYAPVVAYTLGLALSWLPALTAYGVWLCLCELALLRNIRLTVSLCSRRSGVGGRGPGGDNGAGDADGAAGSPGSGTGGVSGLQEVFAHPHSLAALWLLFSPYYLELYVGQFTFITASLVFWAYLSWSSRTANPDQLQSTSRSHPRPSASSAGKSPLSRLFACFAGKSLGDLAWAAAVLLKMMPLLFLPIALIRGRWKSAVATMAVLVVSSWVYFQRFPADWRIFTDTNADPVPTWHAGNQGLMALLYALSGERVAVYLVYRNIAMVLVGALLAWLMYRAWKGSGFRVQGSGGAGATDGSVAGSPLLHYSTTPLLLLYAALSAGYLLCYKDVWEHHYVLLLPPLVLLALRRESPWLWLPPFLVSALPTLFALYDVPGIGYNEDPQRYWVPSVSLLHHAWKPVAPLWLTLGIALSAWRSSREGSRSRVAPPTRASALRLCVSAVSLIVLGFGVTSYARAAISEQRAVTREVIWPEDVFQKQVQPENCGPAALAAICRHFGITAREGEIAGLAGTTLSGTSMLGLQRAAEAKGLAVSARRVSPAELRSLPRPCLLFFHEGHFAVLTGVQGQSFYVADPSLGQRVWPEAYLRRYWRGEVLLLGPSEARAIPTSH